MAYSRKTTVYTQHTGGGNLCPLCKSGTLLPSKFKKGEVYCNQYKSGCKYKGTLSVDNVASVATEIPVCSTLSNEQQIILDEVKTTNSNVIISALAGTGKTFEMVQCVRVLAVERKLKVLCLAFAKRDEIALTGKVAGKATVKTSNGAGHSIINQVVRQNKWGKLDVQQNFARTLLETQLRNEGVIPEFNDKDGKWQIARATVTAAIDLCEKARNVLPLSVDGKKEPTDKDWQDLLLRFGIELREEDILECFGRATWLFKKLANLETLKLGADFTNQIFLPSYHNLPAPELYDRVLVDESQDQSYATRRIALLYLKPNTGRLIAVGDKNQAIYGWRGADSEAMKEMAKAMTIVNGEKPLTFPLTECRRCSKAVIKQAQYIVPTIKALPDAIEGEIEYIRSDDEFIEVLKKERKGLVLCRANAPSVSICLKLLAAGIPAAMTRSDVVHQLLKLIDKCSPNNGQTEIGEMLGCVNEWAEGQLTKMANYRNATAMMQNVRDKVDVINAMALADNVKTVGDMKKTIDLLFPAYVTNKKGETVKSEELPMEERSDMIVLFSTVHGAKGGEADTVYLYSPDKGKISLWDCIWSDEIDRDNVIYVGITRSKNRLIHVGMQMSFQRFSKWEDEITGEENEDTIC